MSLFANLDNARRLVDRIQARCGDSGDTQLLNDLAALTREIEALEHAGRQLEAENQRLQQAGRAGPEAMAHGCYRFPGDDALYCPTCWDSRDRKTATRRLSARRRVCPVCRASITS